MDRFLSLSQDMNPREMPTRRDGVVLPIHCALSICYFVFSVLHTQVEMFLPIILSFFIKLSLIRR